MKNRTLLNMYEYANEVICIFVLHIQVQCLSFTWILLLLNSVKNCRRYDWLSKSFRFCCGIMCCHRNGFYKYYSLKCYIILIYKHCRIFKHYWIYNLGETPFPKPLESVFCNQIAKIWINNPILMNMHEYANEIICIW